MLLSQAILLGSIETEQGFGRFLDEKGRACAMGAAYIAVGLKLQPVYSFSFPKTSISVFVNNAAEETKARELWPHLSMQVNHPVSGVPTTLLWAIEALNDVHQWTRPQIAAWVATVEPQEEQVVVEEQCLVAHGQAL